MTRSSQQQAVGKGGARPHRQQRGATTRCHVTRNDLRRLARRGGVKRIGGEPVYEEARAVLRHFIRHLLHDAMVYAEHARRRTISTMDVVTALKRNGTTLYVAEVEGGFVASRRPKPATPAPEPAGGV